ncbi:MAG: 4Fe-4S binding protein [Methanomicrobiaceae archaeon]|nr:4Fe-4S binding protein [Methanomicrobiaceae archaeon]
MDRTARRQRIRKGLIFLSFMLYPVTFAYISCPIITEGASMGIVTGGLIVFFLLFIGSLFAGRVWCGYVCPSGGLQEIYRCAYDRPLRTRKLDMLKYLVFLGIFGSLFYAAYTAGGFSAIDLFYRTESGISIAAPGGVASFLGPVVVITVFALIFGRRGFCHTFCPIAVMLIIGRKIRNLFGWPALHLEAEKESCIDCRKCSEACPMTLDVNKMVREEKMEQTDCILCGSCVDICPTGAIIYSVKGR